MMTQQANMPSAPAVGARLTGPGPTGTCERPQPLNSDALLQGRRMVEITHNGEVYRLQATRLGKLILTK